MVKPPLRDFTERNARFLTGFIGASVHASLDGHRVVNYVQWESKADLGAMMASAPAKAHVARRSELSQNMSTQSSTGWRSSVRVSVRRSSSQPLLVAGRRPTDARGGRDAPAKREPKQALRSGTMTTCRSMRRPTLA